MNTIYKVMVIKDVAYPRIYNTYSSRQLAVETMNKLNKKGLFTYINIENKVTTPVLQLVKPEINGYIRMFIR